MARTGQNPKIQMSRYLSKILRHRPDLIGLEIAPDGGWADVQALLDGINRSGKTLTREMLENIVATDAKGRYSFNDDHSKIRANQGHSIPVEVEMQELDPPDYLYHGTAETSLNSILVTGLQPMTRLYVHLSWNPDAARKVGQRHGKPVVLEIDCASMRKAGYRFWLTANRVWQTKYVPPEYLRKI